MNKIGMGDDQLKKEVINLFSQGHDHNAVKSKLLEQGYTIDQINQALKEAFTYKNPPKKGIDRNLIILIGTGIIAIILIFTTIIILQKPHYSQNPKDWIQTNTDGTQTIDIKQATQGAGQLDPIGLQYDTNEVKTAFRFDGVYLGEIFSSDEYYDANNNLKIRISEIQNPNDNIPEIMIMEKINKNEEMQVFVFLDEDWKRIIGEQTKIIWGKTYQNEKIFEFNEISQGLYYDTVLDDKTRFLDNFKERYGGIVVGKVNKEDIIQNNISDIIIVRLS